MEPSAANAGADAGQLEKRWMLANSASMEMERAPFAVTASNSTFTSETLETEGRFASRASRPLVWAVMAAPFLLTQSATNSQALMFERAFERREDSSDVGSMKETVVAYKVLGAQTDLRQGSSEATKGAVAAAYAAAHFDEDAEAVADPAMQDALRLLWNNDLKGEPAVLFSEDGLLTLEWHRAGLGAILLFSGDKSVSIAFRRPGVGYAENGLHAPVDGDLPLAFHKMLAQLLENA